MAGEAALVIIELDKQSAQEIMIDLVNIGFEYWPSPGPHRQRLQYLTPSFVFDIDTYNYSRNERFEVWWYYAICQPSANDVLFCNMVLELGMKFEAILTSVSSQRNYGISFNNSNCYEDFIQTVLLDIKSERTLWQAEFGTEVAIIGRKQAIDYYDSMNKTARLSFQDLPDDFFED